MLIPFEFTPPPRPAPAVGQWTTVEVQEAATSTGPWTLIDTIPVTLTGDPVEPAPVEFSTDAATLPAGWYRVRWLDALANTSEWSAPLLNDPVAGAVIPTVREVAALLQERTWANGTQQGTFTTATTPTAAQARELIDFAARDVRIALGGTVPAGYEERARHLTVLRAATLIENSLFRRDVEAGTSPYTQYQAMYLADLEQLQTLPDVGVTLRINSFASLPVVPPEVDPLARLLP